MPSQRRRCNFPMSVCRKQMLRHWIDGLMMAAHRTIRLRRTRLFSSPVFQAVRRLAMNLLMVLVFAALVLILMIIALSAIRVVQQYERGVIFVLGRLIGAKGPGL